MAESTLVNGATRRRPSLPQRVLALWSFYLIPVLACICAEFIAIKACDVTWLSLHDWKYLLLFVAVILTSGPFGFMMGLVSTPIPDFLLKYFAERMNGGPFKVGDRVQIIAGKFAGTVTIITDDWQGGDFRVDLGEAKRKEFSDIFGPNEIMREPEQASW